MTPKIAVRRADFDPGAEIAALEAGAPGAIASFCGNVRGEGGLVALELEHFPGMTERALAAIVEGAAERWPLSAACVIHRYGRLEPGAPIVFVGTAAAHRRPAIEAMHCIIDRLKTDAPFWKREIFADGRAQWVEARAEDDAAGRRWQQ